MQRVTPCLVQLSGFEVCCFDKCQRASKHGSRLICINSAFGTRAIVQLLVEAVAKYVVSGKTGDKERTGDTRLRPAKRADARDYEDIVARSLWATPCKGGKLAANSSVSRINA
jgi:hypothetical protein